MKTKKALAHAISIAMSGAAFATLPAVVGAQTDEDTLEEVVVTGSRIAQSGLESVAPVTMLNNEALQISANNSIADTLFDLPSAGVPEVSQTNSNFTVFSQGVATIDLRNLGEERTLVLVNGRRHVGGAIFSPSVVDLNSIPNGFVDRIEIVTGGASAIYGSEAMSGVVNIITKDRIDGVEVSLRSGVSDENDGEDSTISITGGTSFANDRGNVMFHLGYQDLKEIKSSDRTLAASDNDLGDFRSFSSFAPQGSVIAQGGRTITQAADGSWTKDFVSAEDGFNRAAFRRIQIPLERQDAALNLSYDINDSLSVFLESSYTETESVSNLEPSITGLFITVGDDPLVLPSDNPFIPQEILDTWLDAGEAVPANLNFLKRFLEVGPRKNDAERETTRIALGLEGEINEWTWEAYYQWGNTDTSITATGDFNTLRFQQGLIVEADPDNPGGFRCVDADARSQGCVPIDVFGTGSISQEAVDFVAVPARSGAEIEQQVAAFNIAGNIADLPAGPMGLAVGAEWREEEFEQTTDPLAAAGLSSANTSPPIEGDFDVWEVYAEVKVPLMAGAPGVEYLGLDAAIRFADYSTVGEVDQWKIGGTYSPHPDVRFRAVQAQSVRAPNLSELFDPGSETFRNFTDPCTNGGVGRAGNTQANCASVGALPGFDPGVNGSSAGGFQSGNPDLIEETSDTFTFGIVYTPSWLEGSSITIDYFDIEIEDAIELIDPQVKLNQCYAAGDFPNNQFCDGIFRDPSVGNIIRRLDFGLENIGQLNTSGIDVEFNYLTDVRNGSLAVNALVTWTEDWEREIFDIVDSNYEEPGFNEWKATARLVYTQGPWRAAWSTRFIGEGVADNNFTFEDWPLNRVDAQWYHDVQLNYTLEANITYDFSFGVKNAFDEDAPYIPEPSENTVTGTGTAADVYDVIGRFFYAGVDIRF